MKLLTKIKNYLFPVWVGINEDSCVDEFGSCMYAEYNATVGTYICNNEVDCHNRTTLESYLNKDYVNENYGKIALVVEECSKDFHRGKVNFKGHLVEITNQNRFNPGKGEEYRFLFYEEKGGLHHGCKVDDLIVIDEDDFVESVRKAWIEGFGLSIFPIEKLKNEYRLIKENAMDSSSNRYD